MLPFTHEQFLAVFASYNAAIWPAQGVAYGFGLVAVALVSLRRIGASRAAAAILAVMWLWTGVAYHWAFFSGINRAAWYFGALFVGQALLTIHAGVLRTELRLGAAPGLRFRLGGALIAYAAIVYPLIGLWAGQVWPGIPMFGVTPCPVTLFTLGMFLLAESVPRRLLVIPALWSAVGGSAAILLHVPQDWVLLAGSALALPLLLRSGPGREEAGAE
jgi:hypothetical protein